MRQMTTLAGLSLILCLLTFASGCAVQEPIVRSETVTLYQDVIIPVPAELTKTEAIPQLAANPDTIDLGVTYLETLRALKIAYAQLFEISELK